MTGLSMTYDAYTACSLTVALPNTFHPRYSHTQKFRLYTGSGQPLGRTTFIFPQVFVLFAYKEVIVPVMLDSRFGFIQVAIL